MPPCSCEPLGGKNADADRRRAQPPQGVSARRDGPHDRAQIHARTALRRGHLLRRSRSASRRMLKSALCSATVDARPRRQPGRSTMGRSERAQPVHGWVVLDKPQRHDLDRRPSARSNACSMPRRRAMPARSIRWRPASWPWRWARRPRPCPTPWTARRLYRFTARWGEARDTDDAEGEVTGTSDERPTEAEIEAQLPRFTGDILPGPAGLFRHQGGGRAGL